MKKRPATHLIKFVVCLFCCVVLSGLIVAKNQEIRPVKRKVLGPYVIELDPNPQILRQLAMRGIIFDHFAGGGLTRAYVNQEDLQLLARQGIWYSLLDPERGKRSAQLEENYHTYQQLTDKLHAIAEQFPLISKLESIGQSNNGKELWVLKISDHAMIDEIEPEVKLIAAMHGDEIVGQEILIRLIEYLVSSYQFDDHIKQIIDSTEIWIMPTMNPDGTARYQRQNAKGIDLNRDFPDLVTEDDVNSTWGREPETASVMTFSQRRNFSLSANFHAGALVVNYPWDSLTTQFPDRQAAIFVAKEYARLNVPMADSFYFSEGITNGYDWYPIYGGMQDWSYIWHQCLELTIELYDTKWPDYSKVDSLWMDNQESLIRYLTLAHSSYRGVVIDNETEIPVLASYQVQGIEKVMKTSPVTGEFNRILMPGSYDVTFTAEGYNSKTLTVEVSGAITSETNSVRLEKTGVVDLPDNDSDY